MASRENHYVPRWYQEGFFEPGKNTLAYLDLEPVQYPQPDGTLKPGRSRWHRPTSLCFVETDLYSTFFGMAVNDEIERMLFGAVDRSGAPAVRAFMGEDKNAWIRHFQTLFGYIDSQKLRTPKGLAWLRAQYPSLTQNELMQEMQGIRMMNCTIWSQGVREIVSAEESDVEFLVTDHPVTVYNSALPPTDPRNAYPHDPSVALKGTQTLFPLSRDFCLILTNLEFAQEPGVAPLEKRTFARNFRQAMVKAGAFIRSRSLERQDVLKINAVLKARAGRYLAAGQEDWLYPEDHVRRVRGRRGPGQGDQSHLSRLLGRQVSAPNRHALNAEGEPGPRGGEWTPSAIYGDRRAKDDILCQELYIGVRVYNRRRFRKHPDTGKRSSILNPEADWMREAVPALRILDDDLWSAVAARQQTVSEQPAPKSRPPKRLLSGLMRCSLCGSGMTLNGQKFACSAARERGTCSNTKIIAAKTIEARVLDGIAAKLLAPEAIATAVSTAQAEATQRQHQTLKARAPMEKELGEIARKLERAQVMCMDGAMEIDELKARSAPLKARREELQALLSEIHEPAVLSLHPGVAEAYRRMAEQLRAALDEADSEDARNAVRSLIDQVVFIPVEGLGKFDLDIQGNLARLLRISGAAGGQTAKSPAARGSGAFEDPHRCEVLVGAGAGFEPATFRL